MKNKIGFISLGCCKNLVDAERIMSQLVYNGYKIVDNYSAADLIIINTCGFINDSIKESFDTITETLQEHKPLLITGCLGARAKFIEEHFRQFASQIVGITGPHSYDQVCQMVMATLPLSQRSLIPEIQVPNPGIKLTPEHYAYLKISEGCSNKCTFCAIPLLRGPMISRPINQILQESDALIERGVKELMVVAQDTLDYGRDLNYATSSYLGREYKADFLTLLDFLSRKDIWVRLHYLYPYPIINKIIPYLKDTSIVPYLDIPLQHSSVSILKQMKRPGNVNRITDQILSWKEQIPDLCLRSTFIVGFPGETDQDFEQLLQFIKDVKMQRVGCFTFSNVHGVRANDLPDQIPEHIKQQRREEFMKIQQEISMQQMAQKIGSIQNCVIDDIDEEEQVLICRSKYDSPEIDGNVFVTYDHLPEDLTVGQRIDVKITDSNEYDLFAALDEQ